MATTTLIAPRIGDRSYGIIPMRFISSVTDTSIDTPTTSNTQILLIQQRTVTAHVTYWGFPKGHAESADASIKHTAIRELLEETSLKVEMKDLVVFQDEGGEKVINEVYINPVRKVGKEVRFWPGLVRGDQEIKVQIEELAGAEWMGWEEAVEKLTFTGGKEMLKGVMRLLDGRK